MVEVKSKDPGLSVTRYLLLLGPEHLNTLGPCFIFCHVGIYYSYCIGSLEGSNKKMHHHRLEKIPLPLEKKEKKPLGFLKDLKLAAFCI